MDVIATMSPRLSSASLPRLHLHLLLLRPTTMSPLSLPQYTPVDTLSPQAPSPTLPLTPTLPPTEVCILLPPPPPPLSLLWPLRSQTVPRT